MSGLIPEAEAFAARFRAGEYGHSGLVTEPYVPDNLTPEAEKFGAEYRTLLMHRKRINGKDEEYIQKVHELRKNCDKCDMEIANELSKCKDSSCSMMGGKRSKKRSKKHCKKRSKKNMRRCTTSRRRSRARRSI